MSPLAVGQLVTHTQLLVLVLSESGGFGDVEHAQALVFLQKLVLGLDLLSEHAQFALLQRETHVDPRQARNLLPSLLDLRLQLVQLLEHVGAVFVHAVER